MIAKKLHYENPVQCLPGDVFHQSKAVFVFLLLYLYLFCILYLYLFCILNFYLYLFCILYFYFYLFCIFVFVFVFVLNFCKTFEQFPSLATVIPTHQRARSVVHPCPGTLSRARYQDFLDFIEKQLPAKTFPLCPPCFCVPLPQTNSPCINHHFLAIIISAAFSKL